MKIFLPWNNRATTIQVRGTKMQKFKHPFKKIYITSEIYSRISLQGNTFKNLIKYTSFIAGPEYTKSFQTYSISLRKNVLQPYTKYPPDQHLKHLHLPPLARAPEPEPPKLCLKLKEM